jgi:hypothetical protein
MGGLVLFSVLCLLSNAAQADLMNKIYNKGYHHYSESDFQQLWRKYDYLFDGDKEKICYAFVLERNEIFARHGRYFNSLVIRAYFNDLDWYSPDGGFSENRLNSIEKKNSSKFMRFEQRKGCNRYWNKWL